MKQVLFSLSAILLVSTLTLAQDGKDFDAGVAKFRNKEYNDVIETFTGFLDKTGHDKRYDEDLYFYRGQSYFFTNQYDKCTSDMDKCLELNHFKKGVVIWFKARSADKLGKTAEATTLYNDALEAAKANKKTSAMILADRAQFNARHGNKAAAEQDLALAKSYDPTNTEIAAVTTTASASATPANRTAGEDRKTQVIVKNNPNSQKGKDTAAKNNPPANNQPANTASTTPATSSPAPIQASPVSANAELVSAMAATYKDEKRYALVIGNSNYSKEIGILKNPVNDATDVATELRKSNFDVQLITNATYVQIREAMRKFNEKLTEGPRDQTIGLFYYAGHGVAYQDENYLVPIDADVKYEDDITRMCFPVQRMVLANMERTNSRMNIVILDACRNNPFPATTRSVSSGLAEMKRARGSFIAYATAPGSVASDGNGRNGLYTQELLKAMKKPNLTIEQVFKDVRMNVLRLSGDRQFTWDSSNIIGEFYFKFQ